MYENLGSDLVHHHYRRKRACTVQRRSLPVKVEVSHLGEEMPGPHPLLANTATFPSSGVLPSGLYPQGTVMLGLPTLGLLSRTSTV
jgi:hypothetical protein